MNLSTRFAMAVHTLSIVYINPEPPTTQLIASSVNTNPVVIRRIVSSLKKAGLLKAAPGQSGICPTRQPGEISLYDIHMAVDGEETQIFGLHKNVNVLCPIGRNINTVLIKRIDLLREHLLEDMKKFTLQDVLEELEEKVRDDTQQ